MQAALRPNAKALPGCAALSCRQAACTCLAGTAAASSAYAMQQCRQHLRLWLAKGSSVCSALVQASKKSILPFMAGSRCITSLLLCRQVGNNFSLSCLAEGVHVVEDRAVLSHTEALHLTQELVLQGSMICCGLACSERPCWSLHCLQQLQVWCTSGPWHCPYCTR